MDLQLVEEVIALILQIGPLGVQLFLKLESSLNLGPDDKKNIANAIVAANQADQATIKAVSDWMASQGFKPQFVKANP